jgi:protein-tyrosine phosphatase
MIDLHFHCLPGIDDGPATWDDAVSLCQAAFRDGTTTIVATPHVLREPWINDDRMLRADLIKSLNTRLGGRPRILSGCEYYFSLEALRVWDEGATSPIEGLNGTNYLLLEFPATVIPRSAESVIYELSLAGVIPVIAHPERNLVFAQDPSVLGRLVAVGAVTQVTASSITGDFGRGALAASQEFFHRGLVHVIASDAHSVDRRPPRMAAARERVRKEWGHEAEDALFEVNTLAITEGRPLEQVGV